MRTWPSSRSARSRRSASRTRPARPGHCTEPYAISSSRIRMPTPASRQRETERRCPVRRQRHGRSAPGGREALLARVPGLGLAPPAGAGGRVAGLWASNAVVVTLVVVLGTQGPAVARLRAGADHIVGAWSRVPAGPVVTAGRCEGPDL